MSLHTAGALPRARTELSAARRTFRMVLWILLSLGVALRIVLALRPGLWVDEVFSLAMATGHSLEHPAAVADPSLGDYVETAEPQLAARWRQYAEHDRVPAGPARVLRAVFLSDTSPPLYYLLLNGWTRLAGTSDAALRLFSTLAALLCLPLLWHVGRALGGPRVAAVACLLFAFAPAAVHYSAEGRMYALAWLLGLALSAASLALTRRGASGGRVAVWAAIGAAALLTHYFLAFVWLACLAWLLLHPGRARRVAIFLAAALSLAAVAPWYVRLPESLGLWRVTAGWLGVPLTPEQLLSAPFLLGWSWLSGYGIWGGSEWVDRGAAVIVGVIGIAALLRQPRWLVSGPRALPWLWAIAAVVGPVVFDLLRGTNAATINRYALPGLPAAVLIAALAFSRLPRRVYAPAIAALLLCWLPAYRSMLTGPARPWEPFPVVAGWIDQHAAPGDVVVVHSIPSGVLALARYTTPTLPLLSSVPQLPAPSPTAERHAVLAGACRVALVRVHDLGEASPDEAWLRAHAVPEVRREWTSAPLTEASVFRPAPAGGRSTSRCPAARTAAPSAPERS